jgi:hypothetical protein
MIWDPLPRTSISVDYWKIKRTNEINQEQVDARSPPATWRATRPTSAASRATRAPSPRC